MIAFIDDHRGAYGVEPIRKVLPIWRARSQFEPIDGGTNVCRSIWHLLPTSA